ncbi:MAG: ACT domain-containing protein [Planctomycetes bacterium]|nr:ACT domain-containing protein [Planctomycetota bacterium]
MSTTFRFRVHDELLAIARLAQDAPLPDWARGRFFNLARTPDELSIICPQTKVPADVVHERDKVALGIVGVVPMTAVGILAALCAALAAANVPVFVLSTYDTDWLLVSAKRFEEAKGALEGAGHRIEGAAPTI